MADMDRDWQVLENKAKDGGAVVLQVNTRTLMITLTLALTLTLTLALTLTA